MATRSQLTRSSARRNGNTGGGGAGTVTSVNGDTGPAVVFALQSRNYFADQLVIPNADWAVSAIAPTDQDNTVQALPVIEYNDTTEEGRGFITRVPSAAVNGVNPTTFVLGIVSKAATAPGAARTVGVKLYYRQVPDNAAVGAWASIVLPNVDIPANTNQQYDTATLTIGAGGGQLNVTPGRDVMFEVTRVDPSSGTELVGDWNVLEFHEIWRP